MFLYPGKFTFLLVLLCLLAPRTAAQVLPKDGSVLNYRLIGFEFPKMAGGHYKIEIAEGNHDQDSSFRQNIIKTVASDTNGVIIELPAFGKNITWRVASSIRSDNKKSPYHHFTIAMIPAADTNHLRVRILKKAKKKRDAYLLLDDNRAIYDMAGRPLWYLGSLGAKGKDSFYARDLKITPQGTLTFITNDEAYEIDYNGNILWKAPHDSDYHYHHEFTRLSNGHYMALMYEPANFFIKEPSSPAESGLIIVHDSTMAAEPAAHTYPGAKFYTKSQLPEVREYDSMGNMVWEFRSSGYFNSSDLYFKRKEGAVYKSVHENGFYFDEKRKELYISCRDINRVLKVKYPYGNVLDAYGEKFTPAAVQNSGKGLFCGQHNCSITSQGDLMLFNNNTCHAPALPSVIILRQPSSENDSLVKIWEYQCTIDDLSIEDQTKLTFVSGGNVYELPDGALFVNMGGQYSKLVIVNRNKEVLWSALPEIWQPELNKWIPFPQYRASVITRTSLERLIWNAGK